MTPLRFAASVKAEARQVYIVETRWPSSEFGKPENHLPQDEIAWGRYNPTAWNDKTEPNKKRDGFGRCAGNFEDKHPDVAQHPQRVGKPGADVPTFSDPWAAFAYAERLQAEGETAARYSEGGTQADRDARYAGRMIETRVVEEISMISVKVVEKVS